KLVKFTELDTFPNVFQNLSFERPVLVSAAKEEIDLKGKWNSNVFKNDNPITLELACGRGEYTISLARKYPERNFIGVDIKGNRMYTGARAALEEKLENVAFLRTDINLLSYFMAEGEISEIWIIYPDPRLKKSKAKQRLTSSRFLNLYGKICKPGSIIQLKTDDPTLFEFTMETLEQEKCTVLWSGDDIYASELIIPELAIETYYEGLHLEKGRKIKYVRFTL
ncbi:MAG: tRNA (guanine-N7-)-methyltransferase, partial [Limisphaerales bacterium]